MVVYEEKLIELDKLEAERERRLQSFNKVKATAFKILLETTSKSVQADIKTEFDTHDPKVIWEALQDKYGVSPVSKLSRVYSSLIGLVLQADETVAQYCVRLEDVFSTLESRGETITDTFRLAFLINGIEKSKRAQEYQLVMAIQENMNSLYPATRQALIEEEILRGKTQRSEPKSTVVHEASTDHHRSQGKEKNTLAVDVLERYEVKGQCKTPSDNNLFDKDLEEDSCDVDIFTSKVMSLLYLAKELALIY
jgi:hypothetical protein